MDCPWVEIDAANAYFSLNPLAFFVSRGHPIERPLYTEDLLNNHKSWPEIEPGTDFLPSDERKSGRGSDRGSGRDDRYQQDWRRGRRRTGTGERGTIYKL